MRQHSSHSEHSEDDILEDNERGLPNEYEYIKTRREPRSCDPENEYDYYLRRHIRTEKKNVQVPNDEVVYNPRMSSSQQYNTEQRQTKSERVPSEYEDPQRQYTRMSTTKNAELHKPATPQKTRISTQIMDHIQKNKCINDNVILENIQSTLHDSTTSNHSQTNTLYSGNNLQRIDDMFRNIGFIDDDDGAMGHVRDSSSVDHITSNQEQRKYSPPSKEKQAYKTRTFIELQNRERRSSLDESISYDARGTAREHGVTRKQPRPSSLTFGEDHIYNMHLNSASHQTQDDPDFRSLLVQWHTKDQSNITMAPKTRPSEQNLQKRQHQNTNAHPENIYHVQEWREGDKIQPESIIYAKPLKERSTQMVYSQIQQGAQRKSPHRESVKTYYTNDMSQANYGPLPDVSQLNV